jgi:hypothetical protein
MKKWDTDRNGGSKPIKLILPRYNTKPVPTFCLVSILLFIAEQYGTYSKKKRYLAKKPTN